MSPAQKRVDLRQIDGQREVDGRVGEREARARKVVCRRPKSTTSNLANCAAQLDCAAEAALDGRREDDRRRERARDVDAELHDLDPDDRLHPAEVGEDDHHCAEQDDGGDGHGRRVRLRLERRVDGREHEGRQQQPDAVRDVAHDDEERRRQHLDAPAEAPLKELVDRQQLAAEVGRDEEERDHDAPQHVADHELEELEVAAAREGDAGDGDEGDGRGLGGDDGGGDGPPGHAAVADEVVRVVSCLPANQMPNAVMPKR